MSAFYNEFDPKAAAWIRELIAMGEIAPGVVDHRSITEIQPHELNGHTHHHFFAGIAGWAKALDLAGWDRDRPVWSASLPCQPFSVAGQQRGAADDRNLWPAFFRLVCEHRPECIFGEQVAQAIGFDWLDGISADLEAEGYAVGAHVLGACAVGAPHRRQRLYWVAYAKHAERRSKLQEHGDTHGRDGLEGSGFIGGTLADSQHHDGRSDQPGRGSEGRAADGRSGGVADPDGKQRQQGLQSIQGRISERAGSDSQPVGVGDSDREGREEHRRLGDLHLWKQDGKNPNRLDINAGISRNKPEGQPRHGDHPDKSRRERAVAGGPVGDAESGGCGEQRDAALAWRGGHPERTGGAGFGGLGEPDRAGREPGRQVAASAGYGGAAESAGGGFWDDFTIIPCRDGKSRRIESGTFPLVARLPGGVVPSGDPGVSEAQASAEARAMRLKGYGNALCVPLAAEFIRAAMEAMDERSGDGAVE
jgi:DNA (cytosine-5)-methyltransferase 1